MVDEDDISMIVHRIGSTLLIDDFDIHRFLLQQEDCNWKWLKSFICEHFVTRLNEQERNAKQQSTMQQRSLLSKFLYHSLSTSSTTTNTTTISDSNLNVSDCLQDGPLLPEPNVDDVPDPEHKHTYNRNVIWQLNNTKMLIGTDLPIFGGPGISLGRHLYNFILDYKPIYFA